MQKVPPFILLLALCSFLGNASGTAYSEHIYCFECDSAEVDDCGDGEADGHFDVVRCEDEVDVCFKERTGMSI